MQAGVVAAPRSLDPRWATRLRRLRGRGWALVPIASIVGVIFVIRYASGTADWLTYLALVAVPLLAAVALGWLARGSRPWLALLAPALFVLAWRTPYSLAGEAAGALLSGLSCVTLGVLLAAVTPPRWLKLGIVAMACADVWLIASDQLQAPNEVLASAAPGGGLPQLQSEQFGTVTMGYGDLFVAALLGGVYAGRVRVQRLAALLTLGDRGALRPAVPGGRQPAGDGAGRAGAGGRQQCCCDWPGVSACRGRSRPADAIPPPAM